MSDEPSESGSVLHNFVISFYFSSRTQWRVNGIETYALHVSVVPVWKTMEQVFVLPAQLPFKIMWQIE